MFSLKRTVQALVNKKLHYLAVAMGLIIAIPLAAQEIPEEILRQIQKRQTGQSQNTPSPIDVARQKERQQTLDYQADTALEEEVAPSRIEEDYRERTGSEDLAQYGYELFAEMERDDEPVGRISDSYVLGVGDEIVANFVGGTDRSVVTKVDSEGRVVLPQLRPVSAAGRTFGEFRSDLAAQVASALLGTEVYVSVGSLRQVGVLVVGEVEHPGLHRLTNLASVLDALSAAGIKKSGSLRSIRIDAGGRSDVLDIYALMEGKPTPNLNLQDGMSIVVPVIGATVAVYGEVVRPAIYELPAGGEEIAGGTLLELAGGPLRPKGNSLFVNMIETNGRQVLRSLDSPSDSVPAGGILTLQWKRNLIAGQVTLEGHVGVPGPRSLAAAQTVAGLLGGADGLGRAPYLLFAILETKDPTTQSRLLMAIDLEQVLAGAEDIVLNDEDQLYVLSASDIRFLTSPDIRNALLTTKVVKGSCWAVQQFASRLSETDVRRYSAVVRSVYVSADDDQAQPEGDRRKKAEMESSAREAERVATGESAVLREGVVRLDQDQDQEARRLGCSELFDEDVELLEFALEHAVSVTGAVRRPGVFPLAGPVSINSLVAVAGGFTNNADLRNIEILTFSGSTSSGQAQSGRQYVDATAAAYPSTKVVPGSSVRFNSVISDQEPGTILLSGEFSRPGVYSLTRGESLSEMIERAGGVTRQAYPYGAQLTRISVKREQEEGFRRAARELKSALASVVLRRRDVSAEAVIAAQELADGLETVEAPGRVVVEADPVVLRTRPELDIVLEPGDRIHIPKRPNFVVVAGDVLNPGALQFAAGKEVGDYLDESGGMQSSADKGRVYVVYPNGVAEPVKVSRWAFSTVQVPPGSTIVVPKETSPVTLDVVRDVSGIFGQLALAAASLAVIVNN